MYGTKTSFKMVKADSNWSWHLWINYLFFRHPYVWPEPTFFVSRAASSHLDFDLDLASKMDSTNPVYYAQYAHARLCAVLEKANSIPLDIQGKCLGADKELKLLKVLCDFPKEIAQAAEARAPFKITNYIQKLATTIHEFYTECRVLDESNLDVTSSRLALCKAAQIVMRNALTTIGVSSPTKM